VTPHFFIGGALYVLRQQAEQEAELGEAQDHWIQFPDLV